MIDTHSVYVVGKRGEQVKITVPVDAELPALYIEDFESACGAGTGIGDLIVPEKIFGIKVTPACWVHDVMWSTVPRTWANFHASNSIFLSNLISLIDGQSKSWFLKHLRMYHAVTYYNAVDTLGVKIFWRIEV